MKRLLLLIPLVLLAACSTLTGANQAATSAAQVTIEEGATLVIQANCPDASFPVAANCYANRAGKLANVLTALNTAANTPGANVASLQASINAQLGQLTPQESIVVMPLLTYTMQYLQAQTGTGVFGATQLAIVNQVNGWLVYACNLYLPQPAQLHFGH